MSAQTALTRMIQLCHLGLPQQVFIPAFLQELHHLVPCKTNAFLWLDEQGKVTNVYDESPGYIPYVRKIAELFSCGHEISEKESLDYWLSQLNEPSTTENCFSGDFHQSSYYRQVMQPLGYYHACFVPIYDGANKIGLLVSYRSIDDEAFGNRDIGNLRKMEPCIIEGLNNPSDEEFAMTDGWDQGLITFSHSGEIQHISTVGAKLLMMAGLNQIPVDDDLLPKKLDASVCPPLKELLNKHAHSLENGNACRLPPMIEYSNEWGTFIMRVFWLDDTNGGDDAVIGINIRRQEPMVLKLFHRIKNLELTARQENVCLLFSAGHPHHSISERLEISVNTVKEHIRNIYSKLNVCSRAELVEHIMSS